MFANVSPIEIMKGQMDFEFSQEVSEMMMKGPPLPKVLL